MGIISSLRGLFGTERADGVGELRINDPHYEDWETVREFGELETGRAFRQQLGDAGIEAVLTADSPLDRFGRGEIFLQVPPERWSEAEELLSGLTDLE